MRRGFKRIAPAALVLALAAPSWAQPSGEASVATLGERLWRTLKVVAAPTVERQLSIAPFDLSPSEDGHQRGSVGAIEWRVWDWLQVSVLRFAEAPLTVRETADGLLALDLALPETFLVGTSTYFTPVGAAAYIRDVIFNRAHWRPEIASITVSTQDQALIGAEIQARDLTLAGPWPGSGLAMASLEIAFETEHHGAGEVAQTWTLAGEGIVRHDSLAVTTIGAGRQWLSLAGISLAEIAGWTRAMTTAGRYLPEPMEFTFGHDLHDTRIESVTVPSFETLTFGLSARDLFFGRQMGGDEVRLDALEIEVIVDGHATPDPGIHYRFSGRQTADSRVLGTSAFEGSVALHGAAGLHRLAIRAIAAWAAIPTSNAIGTALHDAVLLLLFDSGRPRFTIERLTLNSDHLVVSVEGGFGLGPPLDADLTILLWADDRGEAAISDALIILLGQHFPADAATASLLAQAEPASMTPDGRALGALRITTDPSGTMMVNGQAMPGFLR